MEFPLIRLGKRGHTIVLVGISASILGGQYEAAAGCRSANLSQFSFGDFRVVEVRPAQFPCRTRWNHVIDHQKAPGCFIRLEKISKNDPDLNQEKELIYYAQDSDCSIKPGAIIKKQLGSSCCAENQKELRCGVDESPPNYCLSDPKVWRQDSYSPNYVKAIRDAELKAQKKLKE